MKLSLLNQNGKEGGEITLSKEVFELKPNEKVLSQYVYAYLSNQRQSNANTKDRSEVSGGGRKPWRQKGTGRARFGSSRNPLWKGGGVSMGPTSDINWKKKLNKKFKQAAMKHALSYMMQNKNLKGITHFEIDEKSKLTKQAKQIVKDLKIESKAVIVLGERNDTVRNAFSNIKKLEVVLVGEVNPYMVLNGGTVIFDKKALEILDTKLKGEKKAK